MSDKTFATASNARRAARAAGHALADIDITQDGARFGFTVKAAATAQPEPVLLAGEDGDYGLCTADDANATADRLAAEEGVIITVRNPTTDEVLYTANPPAKPTPAAAAPAAAPAQENDDMARKAAKATDPVALAKEGIAPANLYAVTLYMDRPGPEAALKAASGFARRLGFEVAIVTTPAGDVVAAPAKAEKPARTPKAPKAEKAARAPKDAPSGKTAEVLALCSRKDGATPAELIAATGWTGAPWKYNLDKWSARYGYSFEVKKLGEGKTTETRYVLRKEVAAAA